ncbi:hypothetical protein [Streptomyces sp. NRRL B-1347]|uniref:hypothetical protein n=1 Tax=Streptomyces sp. NRRL B-1347 TaxID=1476877 RepID=UPI0004C6A417|nr:hypothetical protein [Streptomyces sp. NRRL B-1347]
MPREAIVNIRADTQEIAEKVVRSQADDVGPTVHFSLRDRGPDGSEGRELAYNITLAVTLPD